MRPFKTLFFLYQEQKNMRFYFENRSNTELLKLNDLLNNQLFEINYKKYLQYKKKLKLKQKIIVIIACVMKTVIKLNQRKEITQLSRVQTFITGIIIKLILLELAN